MSAGMDLISLLAPEVFLAISALGCLLYGALTGRNSFSRIALVCIICLMLALLFLLFSGNSGKTSDANGLVVIDQFSVFMKTLVILGACAGIIFSVDFNRREAIEKFEYPVIIIFSVIGMMLMISSNDLITLYLGLELQSLSLYVLASFKRDSVRSTEAGLKYFVLGALSSGMLLYGASLVYGFTGTTQFSAIAQAILEAEEVTNNRISLGLLFGLVFVLAGLAFKVAAAPFHMWSPDVYEGAPTPVTAYFSMAPKIAATALLIRVVVEPFGPLTAQWQQILWVVSVLSMAVGAFAAIWQTNIKRLMAYSSIGHIGYALIGLVTGGRLGVAAVALYLAIYLFMTLVSFGAILAMRVQGRVVEGISDLSGLSKTHPILAIALAGVMFSMAGIPPLAGFFAKFYIFDAAIRSGFFYLAIIGVASSVVGSFYYLRIIKVMFFDGVSESLDRPVNGTLNAMIAVGAVVTFFFFILPAPLVEAADAAAASLFPG